MGTNRVGGISHVSRRLLECSELQSLLASIVNITNLNLRLSVAFGEHLLETCLENTNVVVNDGLLLRWIVLAHDAHQCEISVDQISTSLFSKTGNRKHLLVNLAQIEIPAVFLLHGYQALGIVVTHLSLVFQLIGPIPAIDLANVDDHINVV